MTMFSQFSVTIIIAIAALVGSEMIKPDKHKTKPIIVIVGSGAAGLSAAIEASRQGSSVVLLEKESKLGGNSAKATSGMNAVSTYQNERGIEDNFRKLRDDTNKVGNYQGDPRLVDLLARYSTAAIEFLKDFGLRLSEISQCGGHRAPRTHRCPPSSQGNPLPVGFTIVKQLQTAVSNIPSIKIMTSTDVIGLLWETTSDGLGRRVYGVQYSQAGSPPVSLPVDAVVLATGGMAYDRTGGSLLAEFAPQLCTLPTTSGTHADGKGMRMGREVGAELIHMDKVQVHPTGLVNRKSPGALTKFLCPEAARGSGAVMVNGRGQRFVNELGNRAYVTDQIFKHCGDYEVRLDSGREQKVAYLLFNDDAANLFGIGTLQFYMKVGLISEYANLTALSVDTGIPLLPLQSTLHKYNEAAMQGNDEFGKTVFPVKQFRDDQRIYVALVTPVLHYTMGGLRIDSSAQVQWLRSDGQRAGVTGLFAAGEVTGGVHGDDRLAGNSLLDCVVFGRIAGLRAASMSTIGRVALTTVQWTPLRLRHKTCSGSLVNDSCDLYELSFELPHASDAPGVAPGASVEVRAAINGEFVVRKYSPVSRPDALGHIDFWLKLSATKGTMRSESLEFRLSEDPIPLEPMPVREEEQRVQHVVLLACGAGIAPLLQILRETIRVGFPYQNVLLLWSVSRASDLFGHKPFLDAVMQTNPQLKVQYIIGDGIPVGSEKMVSGRIDAALLGTVLPGVFPTDSSTKILICASGKTSEDLKKTLTSLGYPEGTIYSYL